MGDSLWWAIVAFTTVGYGDIYPITPLGKLLSCIISLIGIAMIAIPTRYYQFGLYQHYSEKKEKAAEDKRNKTEQQMAANELSKKRMAKQIDKI